VTTEAGVPAAMRGRVMGLYMLVFLGGAPFGSLLVGWAAEQFGAVELGDRRLNKRVVTVAAAMAADPSGSIPKQNKACWARTKGAYRLFDHERATFETLSQPHWQQTRRQCDGGRGSPARPLTREAGA
jgi:hypothetical protein